VDSILTDQVEWLISGNMEGLRFKRQMVLLIGCLTDGQLPDAIEKQLLLLSQRIALEEVFASLLEPLNVFMRNIKDSEICQALDLSGLLAQINSTRDALNGCEPVNQAALISWILGRAKELKLLPRTMRAVRTPRMR